MRRQIARFAVLAALAGGAASLGAQTETGRRVLDYCLSQPQKCALSVRHLTGGWERHYNGDRLEPAGFADLTLLLGAVDAIQAGQLDPGERFDRGQWAAAWIGFDRGALQRAFQQLGSPDDVSLNDLVRSMIAYADRAAFDAVLRRLGVAGVSRGLALWPGFQDRPAPYSATRALWTGTPAEPTSARRLLRTTSGVGSRAYRDEVEATATALREPGAAAAIRQHLCSTLPWESADDSCRSASVTRAAQMHALARTHVGQATTRSCSQVMADLLRGTGELVGLAAAANDHLEANYRAQPILHGTFSRLANVSRDIVPGDAVTERVATIAFFLQATSGGAQVVGCVSIAEAPGTAIGNLFEFGEAVLLDPAFAAELRARLPAAPAVADLTPRVFKIKHRVRKAGDTITAIVDVINGGSAAVAAGVRVRLLASDDALPSADDTVVVETSLRAIAPSAAARVRLRGKRLASLSGRTLIVVVDPDAVVDDASRDNNVAFETIS